jgi:hypothetical protein
MKSLKFIAVLCLVCGSAFAETKNPYSSNLNTSAKKLKAARTSGKKKSNYEAIDAVTVAGRTYGLGNFTARFNTRKNVTWTSSMTRNGAAVLDRNTPTLLQGSVSVNGSWKMSRDLYPAAASVIGNTAKFEFPGKVRGSRGSRQRFYRVTFKVGSDDKVRARVSSIPSSAMRDKSCESLGHAHQASHSHAKTVETVRTLGSGDTFRVATLSTEADPAWYARHGANSNAEIAAIVNTAEAVYERQLGIRFRIVKQHVYTDSATSPFTTTIAGELLGQFLKNPANADNLGNGATTFNQDVDLKHLFTGGELHKDSTLTNVTTGMAFTSAFCWAPDYAYGVTKQTLLTSVTFAHEIGHNFGAAHDPNDQNGIMYTYIRPNSYFSMASVDQVNAHLKTYGSCLSTEQMPANLINSKLTIKRRYIKAGKVAKIEGTLLSIQGNPVANAAVTIHIGSRSVSVQTDTKGAYSFNLQRKKIPGRVAVVYAETAQGETQTAEVLTVSKA